jgi:hypothetical protein
MPLRSLVALAVVAVLAALIVWATVILVRSRQQSALTRVLLVGAIVALIVMALWIIFILPAYWD